jgi:hypothetical protein
MPAAPCLAVFRHMWPDRIKQRRAAPSLPGHNMPSVTRLDAPTEPRLPRRNGPRLSGDCRSKPSLPCPAGHYPAKLDRAYSRLACPTTPWTELPCRADDCRVSPCLPKRTKSDLAPRAQPRLPCSARPNLTHPDLPDLDPTCLPRSAAPSSTEASIPRRAITSLPDRAHESLAVPTACQADQAAPIPTCLALT